MGTRIKVVIGVVVVVVLVVLAVSLLTGGDDEPSTSATRGEQGDSGDATRSASLRAVASKRGEGKNATASTSAVMDRPREIWLRVSAAPKQQVKGQWNVSCGGGSTVMDTFTVTPPHLQQLKIPRKNARSCVAGAIAQLETEGRLKLTILRER